MPCSNFIKDYFPHLQGKTEDRKTLFLLPPNGGENILDHVYANHFCYRGYRVTMLTKWDFQDEASLVPTMHDRGTVRALAAMRNTLDYINPERVGQVGILGTSVGAISASLAMSVDDRIAACRRCRTVQRHSSSQPRISQYLQQTRSYWPQAKMGFFAQKEIILTSSLRRAKNRRREFLIFLRNNFSKKKAPGARRGLL